MSELLASGFVPVCGSLGGRYLVGVWPAEYTAQVYKLERDDIAVYNEDIHPSRHYCLMVYDASNLDAAIAKVLLIEADERRFLQKANQIG